MPMEPVISVGANVIDLLGMAYLLEVLRRQRRFPHTRSRCEMIQKETLANPIHRHYHSHSHCHYYQVSILNCAFQVSSLKCVSSLKSQLLTSAFVWHDVAPGK